jgi:DNA-binding NarL/FixJ family response regulator
LLTCSQPRTTLDAVTDRSKPSPARILVVYDNPAILDHVTDMLQPDYQVIGSVADGDSVCAEVERLSPDLIVLDISLGERSGIAIARQLREQGYSGAIVFLTVHEDSDFVSAQSARAAGAT